MSRREKHWKRREGSLKWLVLTLWIAVIAVKVNKKRKLRNHKQRRLKPKNLLLQKRKALLLQVRSRLQKTNKLKS